MKLAQISADVLSHVIMFLTEGALELEMRAVMKLLVIIMHNETFTIYAHKEVMEMIFLNQMVV